ncbi:MAG: J domain-containing protein [Sandarakinorhabdus sp.]|nr:J domain-containing protein [Sandarakinorhabdus sp.]
MGFLGLLVMGVVGWLWWKGRLGPDGGRKLALAGAGVLSLWLMSRGQMVPGLVLAAATLALGFAGYMRKKVSAVPMDEIEARQILGVGLNATAEEILAAHRRIIARVHPDKFPADEASPDLARRVNAARDMLLRKQPGRKD